MKAGQALICGIAIACKGDLDSVRSFSAHSFSWAAQDKEVMEKTPKELLPEDKNARANVTYQAEDAVLKGKFIKKEVKKQTGVFFGKGTQSMQFIDSKGVVLKEDNLTFAETPGKWRMLSTTTGTYINAGYYKVVLSAPDMEGLALDALDVQ